MKWRSPPVSRPQEGSRPTAGLSPPPSLRPQPANRGWMVPGQAFHTADRCVVRAVYHWSNPCQSHLSGLHWSEALIQVGFRWQAASEVIETAAHAGRTWQGSGRKSDLVFLLDWFNHAAATFIEGRWSLQAWLKTVSICRLAPQSAFEEGMISPCSLTCVFCWSFIIDHHQKCSEPQKSRSDKAKRVNQMCLHENHPVYAYWSAYLNSYSSVQNRWNSLWLCWRAHACVHACVSFTHAQVATCPAPLLNRRDRLLPGLTGICHALKFTSPGIGVDTPAGLLGCWSASRRWLKWCRQWWKFVQEKPNRLRFKLIGRASGAWQAGKDKKERKRVCNDVTVRDPLNELMKQEKTSREMAAFKFFLRFMAWR